MGLTNGHRRAGWRALAGPRYARAAMSQSLPELAKREYQGRRIGGRRPEQQARRTRRQNAVALMGVPLFAGFGKRPLQRLASEADQLDFEPGHDIVREGDPGETLFVVLEGEGKVVRGKRRVGLVLPGDFFGELSAIDGGPRTASVVAVSPMRVLRLFRRTLIRLLEDEPRLTLTLIAGMARRVREVDRRAGG
jgi:CRP/FNR family transcriptional regulator, cyclic AMP receptor protein